MLCHTMVDEEQMHVLVILQKLTGMALLVHDQWGQLVQMHWHCRMVILLIHMQTYQWILCNRTILDPPPPPPPVCSLLQYKHMFVIMVLFIPATVERCGDGKGICKTPYVNVK